MSDRRNEAVYRAITGGRSPRTEQATWMDGLRFVVGLTGGNVSAAARALDVPRRTLRRWLAGEGVPPAHRRAQVARMAGGMVRRQRLPEGRERRLRRARSVIVKAYYRYDRTRYNADARDITFRVGDDSPTGLNAGVMGDVIERYLAGGEATDESARGFNGGLFGPIAAAMGDEWYREHMQTDHPEEGFDVFQVRFR